MNAHLAEGLEFGYRGFCGAPVLPLALARGFGGPVAGPPRSRDRVAAGVDPDELERFVGAVRSQLSLARPSAKSYALGLTPPFGVPAFSRNPLSEDRLTGGTPNHRIDLFAAGLA